MKRPRISIVIPVRNMARFLAETLQSAMTQTSETYEVIVVDDRSTDETAAIVEQLYGDDPRLRMVKGEGRGVSVARNLGASLTQGEILLFLDGDDLLAPDALDRFAATLDANPDASAAIGGVQRINEAGEPLPGADNRELVPEGDQLRVLLRKNFVVNGGNLAVRTADFRRTGGFDPRLKNGEDWVFWCRLAALGRFAKMEGAPVLHYRQVASGANATARRPLSRVPSIEAMAEDAMIQQIVGDELPALLRHRKADYYWSGVRNELLYGANLNAAYLILIGMVAYPQSFAQPYLAVRFMKSLALKS